MDRGRPVRRRHLGRRRAGAGGRGRLRRPRPAPHGRARRAGRGLADGRPAARPARPGGRGAAQRARLHARALPAVLRVGVDRRVRGGAVERAGVRRVRAVRRHGRRPHRGHPRGDARPRAGAEVGRRARPAAARPRLGGRVRRDHLRAGAGASRPAGPGLRGLAVRLVRRGRRRAAAPRPGRPPPRGPAAVGRDRDHGGAGRSGGDRRRLLGGRGPGGPRVRGRPRPRRRPAGRGRAGAARRRRRAARRRAGGEVGARPLQRPLPARRPPGRRRLRRDAGDRRLLVGRSRAVRGRPAGPDRHAVGRRDAAAGDVPHLARVPDRRVPLLHGRVRAGRGPRRALGRRQARGLRRDPRGGRDDQPSSRGGHRPPRLVRPGDRAARRRRAARRQGPGRSGRDPQPGRPRPARGKE